MAQDNDGEGFWFEVFKEVRPVLKHTFATLTLLACVMVVGKTCDWLRLTLGEEVKAFCDWLDSIDRLIALATLFFFATVMSVTLLEMTAKVVFFGWPGRLLMWLFQMFFRVITSRGVNPAPKELPPETAVEQQSGVPPAPSSSEPNVATD